MINPENMPTTRIFVKDGRRIKVPTNKGLKETPEERKLKSEHMRGVPKKREVVEGWSTVWNVVKPLCARGALKVDIAEITGLSKTQVNNAIAINSERPEWNRVTPFVIPGEPNARTRARKRRELRKNGISEDEAKSIQFAKLMLEKGFIKQDVEDWKELHELYKRRNESLPASAAKQLRLEFFLRARTLAQQQDVSLLVEYDNLGRQVDPAWFDTSLAREEDFIMRVLNNGLAVDEDNVGLYRPDRDGFRWRVPIGVDEHGGTIFDNRRLSAEREEARVMVATGANGRGYTKGA